MVQEVPKPYGVSKESTLQKRPGLKAEAIPANGGIGVSYSSVVLGQVKPTAPLPRSQYR
jgi:hypothetical protein